MAPSSPDYGRLKELLEAQETFPLQYTFKVIGDNTPDFARSLEQFEKAFPKLTLQNRRESAGGAHVAITYSLLADNAAEIVWLYEQASSMLRDLKAVL